MILIVDSGSTKSDWILVEQSGKFVDSYKTIGFNPFFHSSNFIAEEIAKNEHLIGIASQVTRIYYYGAGCSSDHFKKIVNQGLSLCFKNAEVHVDHDLIASAYATYDGSPCISCILGTGSNACYFDGKNLKSLNAGLGYILGDEGSGSYFGKKLLSAYLYETLPAEIREDLQKEFQLSRAEIFRHVYELPHANVYLASFTRFIARHQKHAFIQEMLYEGMHRFLEVHVCNMPGYKGLKVHFVGSIAFYFSEPIHKAAKDLGIDIGQIIKSPIQNLVQYHFKHIL